MYVEGDVEGVGVVGVWVWVVGFDVVVVFNFVVDCDSCGVCLYGVLVLDCNLDLLIVGWWCVGLRNWGVCYDFLGCVG